MWRASWQWQYLRTNVTGHFAYFADNLIKHDFPGSWVFLGYILCYLAGAFVANAVLEVGLTDRAE